MIAGSRLVGRLDEPVNLDVEVAQSFGEEDVKRLLRTRKR